MESSPSLLDLVARPLLVEACYGPGMKLPADDTAPSGAVTVNRDWEQGTSQEWYIDWQRWGGHLVQAGLVLGDDGMIRQGWTILDWGLARQGSDGDYPGASGAPLHTASFFVEAVARSLLLQQQANEGRCARTMADYTPKVLAAARWMIRPAIAEDGRQVNRPFCHRWWIMASTLGFASVLTGDDSVALAAQEYACEGIGLLTPEGINPERGGYDVRYQLFSVIFAARYYTVCRDPGLRAGVKDMISRSLSWEMTRMNSRAVVDTTGSTRVGLERTRDGVTKVVDDRDLVEAFVYGAAVAGNDRFGRIAARVASRLRRTRRRNASSLRPGRRAWLANVFSRQGAR